jgi:hypothetical protein
MLLLIRGKVKGVDVLVVGIVYKLRNKHVSSHEETVEARAILTAL